MELEKSGQKTHTGPLSIGSVFGALRNRDTDDSNNGTQVTSLRAGIGKYDPSGDDCSVQ